jgi:hypothetical protein
MENILVLKKTGIFSDFIKSQDGDKLLTFELSRINPVLENIRSEAGDDFLQYLYLLQLAKEPDLMALSSSHHYYYDFNDLKGIKTLINLKKLNNIKSLGSFIHSVVRILPQKANFIGYFKNDTGNRSVFSFCQSTRFFNGLVNYIDSRTDRSLTKNDITRLLEEHKLKIIDITDINGMTYFCSQNTRKSGE